MAETIKTTVKEENKHEHAQTHDPAHEHKHEEKKNEVKTEKTEKKEVKKETPKVTKPVVKKDKTIVRAPSVHMSKRHGMYICSFIKGKTIDSAIADLEQVILLKKAVPFKGEIPHRKGKGMMSGRYPVAAAKLFIPMLKNLRGGVIFNEMDLAKTRISLAHANWSSRPQRKGGRKGKRSYIIIEAKELGK